MFIAIEQAKLADHASIRQAMFLDRASQFVGRHRWPLTLDSRGEEIDEFDDAATTYCIVADGDRHLASSRLRPAVAGSMVGRHFSQFWPAAGHNIHGGTEITRFCASPALSADERTRVVSDLLLGLCRHCQTMGIPSFFGVVFPSVARVFRQAGWKGELLGEARQGPGTAVLMEWRASELVAWDIQEVRARREDLRRQSRVVRVLSERFGEQGHIACQAQERQAA